LLHESLAPGRGHRPGQAIVTTTLAACIVPAALFTLSLPVAPLLKTAALFCAWYLLCHGCFAAPRTPLARAFAWRPLRWLGNMSFSFYLLHGLVLKAGFYVLALIWPPASHTAGGLYFWTLIPATLLLAVLAALAALASALLFLLVERPLSLAPPGPVQAPLRRRSRRSASPGSRWWGRP
jgi:peptidoglycan/LPS O-acetylase OafA/YrhL